MLTILTGVDFENMPDIYEQVKKVLMEIKDDFSISSASNGEENPFSQFKRMKSWNRQEKDYQRPVKAKGIV